MTHDGIPILYFTSMKLARGPSTGSYLQSDMFYNNKPYHMLL